MRAVVIVFCIMIATTTFGSDVYPFKDIKKQQQFSHLLGSLRCLVCQSQNILESNSTFAVAIKQHVYKRYQMGQTDDEIKAFLSARYGDYILYSPPVSQRTGLLWFLPACLMLLALMVFVRLTRGSV